jgi:hypothetical protein
LTQLLRKRLLKLKPLKMKPLERKERSKLPAEREQKRRS